MKEENDFGERLPPANDNRGQEGERAGGLDRRIRIIAQAIGRQIAREHFTAWERKQGRQATNDHASPGSEPEEEGRKPEG